MVTVLTVTLMLNLHKNNTTSSMNALNAPQNIINVTNVPHEECANQKGMTFDKRMIMLTSTTLTPSSVPPVAVKIWMKGPVID